MKIFSSKITRYTVLVATSNNGRKSRGMVRGIGLAVGVISTIVAFIAA